MNFLGVETGEREGNVGERGGGRCIFWLWGWSNLGWVFFFSFIFFGGSCDWDCSSISGWGIVFLMFFPPPLLLNPHYPFCLDQKKCPCFLYFLFYVFFHLFSFEILLFFGHFGFSVDFFSSGVMVMASFVVAFEGDFFFRPRVTWVHPSSPLLRSSPISIVGLVVATAVVVVIVVIDGGDVSGGGDVGLLFFAGRTSRNAPAVYRTSI